MKINVTKTTEIEAAIATAEGKATTRLLSSGEIQWAAESAEKKLEALGVAKKHRVGTKVWITPAKVANSYKWRAEGTGATLERFATGWFVISVKRQSCGNQSYGGTGNVVMSITAAAKAAMPSDFSL